MRHTTIPLAPIKLYEASPVLFARRCFNLAIIVRLFFHMNTDFPLGFLPLGISTKNIYMHVFPNQCVLHVCHLSLSCSFLIFSEVYKLLNSSRQSRFKTFLDPVRKQCRVPANTRLPELTLQIGERRYKIRLTQNLRHNECSPPPPPPRSESGRASYMFSWYNYVALNGKIINFGDVDGGDRGICLWKTTKNWGDFVQEISRI